MVHSHSQGNLKKGTNHSKKSGKSVSNLVFHTQATSTVKKTKAKNKTKTVRCEETVKYSNGTNTCKKSGKYVSNLVFYTQSTSTVKNKKQKQSGVRKPENIQRGLTPVKSQVNK